MEWAIVSGFPNYSVNTLGEVVSNKSGRYLKEGIVGGYSYVKLYDSPTTHKTLKIHRLVAIAFLGVNNEKPFVNHINANKRDNSVDNLEWVTHHENIAHAYSLNLIPALRGELNGMSTLTNSDVLEIRNKYVPRKYSCRKLASEYGVSATKICQIINNKAWRHI